jgi:hypothetical protein
MSTAQQNAQFEAARQKGIKNPSLIGKAGSGAISQAEYNQAMAFQNKQTTSNFVGPVAQKNYSTISNARGLLGKPHWNP